MCLIAWNWQPKNATPLLLLGNRDEFHARPARALQWWSGGHILAGKDLQAGGTWLGVSRTGRLAALTNYRDFTSASNPHAQRADAPSRGELVTEFLNGKLDSRAFLQRLAGRAAHYNPFNLLVFDGGQLLGLQSRHAQIVEMQPGVGAVSNADFHSPWPKLVRLRDELEIHVNRRSATSCAGEDLDGDGEVEGEVERDGEVEADALLALLKNEAIAPDHALPHTGLPLVRERALSAAFITSPDYGTRASSVVRIGQTQASFTERSFAAHGKLGTQVHRFALHAGTTVQNADHDNAR
jgi:uncharacterized protein with NRDE domain